MRVRATCIALASIAALVFGAANASAAEGKFTYLFIDQGGSVREGAMTNPANNQCLDLSQVANTPGYGFRAANNTDSVAIAYSEERCQGYAYFVPPQQSAPSELRVKSVVFH